MKGGRENEDEGALNAIDLILNLRDDAENDCRDDMSELKRLQTSVMLKLIRPPYLKCKDSV